MSRLLICVLVVLTLVSCNSETIAPEYPLSVTAKISVENADIEYTADYSFSDGVSSFSVLQPTMLNGMKLSVSDNDVTVSYHDIILSYNNIDKFGFNSFKDLHNVLMLINELKPQFSNNGEDLHCEVEYNGERVIITADCENCNLDKIIIDDTTYDFD